MAALTPEQVQRLEALVRLLQHWNTTINLVARGDAADIWQRHVLDSAQLAPLLPAGNGDAIDLGSGAGFPGLVLALITPRRFHLVESDQRKAAFLREAVRLTEAAATVHCVRADRLALAPVALVTARALAPLRDLLAMAAPLLTADGICVFPKGRTVDDELTAAARGWHMRVERFPSGTSPGATLLRISEIRRAGKSD